MCYLYVIFTYVDKFYADIIEFFCIFPYSTFRDGNVAGWLQQPCTCLQCCIVAAQCRCNVAATLPCNIARGEHRIIAA